LRIQQIVINLMSNAIKFTRHGKISVTARVLEKLQNNQVKIQFDVSDTGIGIPPEKLTRLFKVFSQVDSSITRKYGGSGLGLAISKKLCEIMGGEIWVNSVEGKGSTFSFTIIVPVAKRVEYNVVVEADVPQQWKEEVRILVVEDNSVNQLVVKQILTKEGYKNLTMAASGVQALEKVKFAAEVKCGFHVILMDLHMPEMDGLTATKNIRNKPYGDSIYIVALSADVRGPMIESCLQSGMNDFLGKPFKQKDLIGAVSRARAALTM
jgi:CheY-like chemotaxis protein